MVQEENFVSRERLISCARGPDILILFETLFLGLDWGCVSDQTVATVGNVVVDWFAYPKPRYEEQTTRLVREYKGDSEYLSVHHPDEPDARDDYPDSTALTVMKAATGKIGEILFG